MIGLKRHTVQVVSHDPTWGKLASDACETIGRVCRDLNIKTEHVGSTSVPGLSAKPILDIAIGMPSLDSIFELVRRLTDIGYIYRGEGEGGVGHLFVWESKPNFRTIHVHAVEYGTAHWKEYVCFRDLLRQNAYLRQQYGDLKVQIATDFQDDRRAYTDSKHEFIRSVLRQHAGLQWGE